MIVQEVQALTKKAVNIALIVCQEQLPLDKEILFALAALQDNIKAAQECKYAMLA